MFSRGKPFDDFNPVVEPPAGRDLPGREIALPQSDENNFSVSGIQNRIHRNRYGRRQGDEEPHIDKHLRPKLIVGVIHLQADLQRACCRIELRQDIAHPGLQIFVPARQGDPGVHSRLDVLRIGVEDIGQNPHPAQVRHPKTFGAAFHFFERRNLAVDQQTRDRRAEFDARYIFPGSAELVELGFPDPQIH